jgi:DNA-binding protein HU-beta
VTQTELIKDVAKRTNSTQKAAKEFLSALLDSVEAELVRGGSVAIPGFGTFRVARRAARKGRNPRTGAPLQVPARRVPVFQAGSGLRRAVSGRG